MKKLRWALGLAFSSCLFLLGGLAAVWCLYNAGQVSAAGQQVRATLAQPVYTRVFTHSVEGASLPKETPDEDTVASYTAPNGLVINSYSTEWTADDLPLLHDELLKNRHGPEIETLRTISLFPGSDEYYGGVYVPVDAPAWSFPYGPVPSDISFEFTYYMGSIELFDADEYNTVDSMAHVLSHEYGHHFAFHYIFTGDEASYMQTDYARLREAGKHDLLTARFDGDLYSEDYVENHYRYLVEVAAEDYMLLMGSPTVRQTARYYDVRQSLSGSEYDPGEASWPINAQPQENMTLPLPGEVPGLREYFYGFLGEPPAAPQQARQEMTLSITPGSVGFDLAGGYQTFVRYDITWNAPYGDAIYTLACYDPDDYYNSLWPIKTVYPGENPAAVVGTVAEERGTYVYWLPDEIGAGDKVFYVTALLPDGTCYCSNKLAYSFG